MKKIVYLASALIITTSAFTQNNIQQPELDTGTIEEKFDYIIEKSTQFRDFQLIRKPSILKVKAHTLDSIKTVRKDLVNANESIKANQITISELKNEVEDLKNEVSIISKDVDSISFMGTDLSKSNYNMIVWALIIILLLGLITFFSMFKKSNMDTKTAKANGEKLENDFDAFRKKAMLKEQEVMRKLQDEINKNSH
jgi:peptidoglycan hydrolase CwlO-like protein